MTVIEAVLRGQEEFYRRYRANPKEINQGLCYYFARRTRALVSEPVSLMESCEFDVNCWGWHQWVQGPNGLHYDAESPEGLSKWIELDFFKRNIPKDDPDHPFPRPMNIGPLPTSA